ncbi:heterogeneous nuclear ribonucleoprotein L-like isoform X3 [Tubulanus polymorphus]|uniref:heterogeneous nuclear ribonucleoprotein L-like isoform X3 n=1 Tax=Tubulanus polymorphus TaxID=672921 RepID=UPI003DA2FF7C
MDHQVTTYTYSLQPPTTPVTMESNPTTSEVVLMEQNTQTQTPLFVQMKRNSDDAEITDGNSNVHVVTRVSVEDRHHLEENKMASNSYDGHVTKRQRTDIDGHGIQSGYGDKYGERQKPSASPVVHVRGLTEGVTEKDVAEAVGSFGSVDYILMLHKKRQALVEFDDVQAAVDIVNFAQSGSIHVGGYPAYFNFSTSQKIQRHSSSGDTRNMNASLSSEANHILLFTVLKPVYPITVDVMHTICSPNGDVQRIVIFKKNGIQAMVEFDTVENAKRAKSALNGCDIYSGCCTLKIDYAKTSKLNVYKNDNYESWDYTTPNPGREPVTPPRNPPLLQDPHYSPGSSHAPPPSRNYPSSHPGGFGGRDLGPPDEPYNNGYSRHPPSGYGYHPPPEYGRGAYGRPEYGRERYPPSDPYGPPERFNGPVPPSYGKPPMYGDRNSGPPPGSMHEPMVTGSGIPQQGAVLMVYGLNMERMNCDRLFNMFCLYGNVVRIKFLKSKEGVAMIQMGDALSVDRSLVNLNNSFFFDSKLQLGKSKQAFLQDVPNPHDLPDGTPSFKDYMGNRNNRFTNPESAQKNRIQPPAKVLHYFNAPPNMSETEISDLFENKGIKGPNRVKPFPSKSERSSTGLIEFENKAEAMEALICANHEQVPNPNGKNPYIFKMCFSMAPIKSNDHQQ